jgi:hypothetical protein
MEINDLNDAIAAVAHQCWCKRMRAAGWRPGDTLDVEWRVHDALRPYAELTPFDREQIREWVGLDELEEHLADAADAALREREMSVRDVRVGMAVRLDNRGPGCLDLDDGPVGRVVSWEVANPATGRLGVIRVAWPDGEVTEYDAAEKALLPAGPV